MGDDTYPLSRHKLTLHFISPAPDQIRVTTFGAQSYAESTIKTYEEFPIQWDYLEEKAAEIHGLLRHAASGAYASGDYRILERMKELGEDLYRDLIPPSLRSKLDAAAGGYLLVCIDGNLVRLPWELFHDGKDFFCRRYRMGRIISVPPSSRRGRKKQPEPPVNVLSVADPRGDLPGAFNEGVRVRDQALAFEEDVEPVLFSNRVTRANLLNALKHCDVFHYAGHIETTDKNARILLADGDLTARQIMESAGRFPFPYLIFLNACRSSERVDTGFTVKEGNERALDLASSFLFAGARIFLGTLWDIPDTVAGQAGARFFRYLFQGASVGGALARTRQDLAGAFGEGTMAWAGYILYGDPGFRLGGEVRLADKFLNEMLGIEGRRRAYLEALESFDPRERFFAGAALCQLGDRRGAKAVRDEVKVLMDLLENISPARRRQGLEVMRILGGGDCDYRPEATKDERDRALRAFLEGWEK